MSPDLDRRRFLEVSATAAGGLLLSVSLPGCGLPDDPEEPEPLEGMPSSGPATGLNAYLEIDPEGVVTVTVPRPEIGQGVRTALAMVVAEELDVEWESVRVEQADLDPDVYGPQYAGGSDSVPDEWEPLRLAGAAARAVLVAAAARRWSVPAGECRAARGVVDHRASDRSLPYGELAGAASGLDPPEDPPLRSPEEFRLVGTPHRNLDVREIVAGRMTYGLDVRVPGMLRAAISRAPVYGGRLRGFDDRDARRVEGVVDVVPVDAHRLPDFPPNNPKPADGVAVLAESTWAAFRGRDALEVEWDHGSGVEETTAEQIEEWSRRARGRGELLVREDGEVEAALADAANVVEAEYRVPFLAHAPMEPMNAVADVRENECEIWAPTQNPGYARDVAGIVTGLPAEAIRVHVVRSGGGFGRRFYADYVAEAVHLSARAGRPVQVVWSREDDVQYSFHRPAACHFLRGGLDENGNVVAWSQHLVNAGRSAYLGRGDAPEEQGQIRGYYYPAGFVPNLRYEYTMAESVVPRGQWRAVQASAAYFVQQAFIDELAGAAGADPLAFQLRLLGEDRPVGSRGWDSGRLRRVFETAAERAGWGEPLPPGRGRGIAATYANSSFVAHVVEVTVSDEGEASVDRVVSAVDCGRVVNPAGARAQVEGCVVYGLSAALYGEITVEGGRVVQSNFHDYRPLRIGEMPEVEVHFLEGADAPQGMGEPPLPPLAPALTAAIHDASGVRVRRLPIGDRFGT
ncbi:MAG: molybdopterin cofactor-binding domain-containing protein [Gemmatimonadota bacterium]|nr:molybdopterin cofactor-binding domain-containing protein [Gemmatimonadota bacterium]